MITKIFLLAATVLIALGMQRASNLPVAEKTTYVIVVHPSNQYTGSPAELRETIKQLYLKNRRNWPGKKKIQAKGLGRLKGTPERRAFLSKVLLMSDSEVERHWITNKQKTGQTRPTLVRSDTMLLKYVKKYEGAFCIITERVAKKAGKSVKVLLSFDA